MKKNDQGIYKKYFLRQCCQIGFFYFKALIAFFAQSYFCFENSNAIVFPKLFYMKNTKNHRGVQSQCRDAAFWSKTDQISQFFVKKPSERNEKMHIWQHCFQKYSIFLDSLINLLQKSASRKSYSSGDTYKQKKIRSFEKTSFSSTRGWSHGTRGGPIVLCQLRFLNIRPKWIIPSKLVNIREHPTPCVVDTARIDPAI